MEKVQRCMMTHPKFVANALKGLNEAKLVVKGDAKTRPGPKKDWYKKAAWADVEQPVEGKELINKLGLQRPHFE